MNRQNEKKNWRWNSYHTTQRASAKMWRRRRRNRNKLFQKKQQVGLLGLFGGSQIVCSIVVNWEKSWELEQLSDKKSRYNFYPFMNKNKYIYKHSRSHKSFPFSSFATNRKAKNEQKNFTRIDIVLSLIHFIPLFFSVKVEVSLLFSQHFK